MFITSDRWQYTDILGKDICFYYSDGTKYDKGILLHSSPKHIYSIKLKSGSTTEHNLKKERWEIFNYDGKGTSLVWGGEFSEKELRWIKRSAERPTYLTTFCDHHASIEFERLYDHSEYTISRCEGEHSELIDGNKIIIKPSKDSIRNQYVHPFEKYYFLWSCDEAKINPITGKFYFLYHHIWWVL